MDVRGSDSERTECTHDRREVLRSLALGLTALAVPWPVSAQEDGGADNETEDGDANETQGADNGEGDQNGDGGTAGESVTVELVDYAYEPGTESPLEIPPGTLVEFVWITDNHNVAVDSQPDDASWDGYEPIENAGFEYEFTFETEGEYEFHCDPHLSLGMVGTIAVNPEASIGGDDGGGEGIPSLVPDPAVTLLVATLTSLVVVMTLVYAFLKYGSDPNE
ncbi:plastocyanin/azurin family copper-binding protein [Natronosalvus rutilus]|uniref:Plastocyanin/azurin family copper-binding protein n=1 Tax=Natronosalvus rutilus TaxID=2953753 RepID=A0A9E7SUP1_9EURY|nr:plastocyanin/azurin family copper-binding protein [Natronosalvus rutilus]UTF52181.1 plastocyanin/azurin family copper-binding protein [Natronosalvus rutilus]